MHIYVFICMDVCITFALNVCVCVRLVRMNYRSSEVVPKLHENNALAP